jgi:Tfp pilus assembly protein FimV
VRSIHSLRDGEHARELLFLRCVRCRAALEITVQLEIEAHLTLHVAEEQDAAAAEDAGAAEEGPTPAAAAAAATTAAAAPAAAEEDAGAADEGPAPAGDMVGVLGNLAEQSEPLRTHAGTHTVSERELACVSYVECPEYQRGRKDARNQRMRLNGLGVVAHLPLGVLALPRCWRVLRRCPARFKPCHLEMNRRAMTYPGMTI